MTVADELLVACLCADWCGACRAFAAEFVAAARACPQARFVWIDVEDHPEVLGDDDIETFPTVLVSDGRGVSFYGAIEPRRSTLQALVAQAAAATGHRPIVAAFAADVSRRVHLHVAVSHGPSGRRGATEGP